MSAPLAIWPRTSEGVHGKGSVWLLQGLLSLGLEAGLLEGRLCFGCVLSGVLFYLISVVRSYLMVFCFKGKRHGPCCFHHIKHITASP